MSCRPRLVAGGVVRGQALTTIVLGLVHDPRPARVRRPGADQGSARRLSDTHVARPCPDRRAAECRATEAVVQHLIRSLSTATRRRSHQASIARAAARRRRGVTRSCQPTPGSSRSAAGHAAEHLRLASRTAVILESRGGAARTSPAGAREPGGPIDPSHGPRRSARVRSPWTPSAVAGALAAWATGRVRWTGRGRRRAEEHRRWVRLVHPRASTSAARRCRRSGADRSSCGCCRRRRGPQAAREAAVQGWSADRGYAAPRRSRCSVPTTASTCRPR